MNKKEEIRTKNLVIRVTENEKKIIENNSKNLGLEVSNYGRQLMINGFVFSVIKKENIIEENFDRKTLIGLANNLNASKPSICTMDEDFSLLLCGIHAGNVNE